MVLIRLVASLLVCGTFAGGKRKDDDDPRENVNLSDIEQWRSSVLCLRNTSGSCSFNYQNYTLTFDGWMNVTSADGGDYCKEGGCRDYTLAVLDCIDEVKRDALFRNGASLDDLICTTTHGCTYGFTGTTCNSHKK